MCASNTGKQLTKTEEKERKTNRRLILYPFLLLTFTIGWVLYMLDYPKGKRYIRLRWWENDGRK